MDLDFFPTDAELDAEVDAHLDALDAPYFEDYPEFDG